MDDPVPRWVRRLPAGSVVDSNPLAAGDRLWEDTSRARRRRRQGSIAEQTVPLLKKQTRGPPGDLKVPSLPEPQRLLPDLSRPDWLSQSQGLALCLDHPPLP